jgi:hypothetical protein
MNILHSVLLVNNGQQSQGAASVSSGKARNSALASSIKAVQCNHSSSSIMAQSYGNHHKQVSCFANGQPRRLALQSLLISVRHGMQDSSQGLGLGIQA